MVQGTPKLNSYALRHLAGHLCDSGRLEDAVDLVMREDFFRDKMELVGGTAALNDLYIVQRACQDAKQFALRERLQRRIEELHVFLHKGRPLASAAQGQQLLEEALECQLGGRFDDATKKLEQAIQSFEGLLEQAVSDEDKKQARTLLELATRLKTSTKFIMAGPSPSGEVESDYRNEVAFLEKLREEQPDSVFFGMIHLYLLRTYGDILRKLGRFEDARQIHMKAVREGETLWRSQQDNLKFGEIWLDALVGCGNYFSSVSADPEAEKVYERAVEIGEKLASQGSLAVLHSLSTALLGLGRLYQARGQDAAQQPLRRAALLAHEVWQASAGSIRAGHLRAVALENLASFLWVAGRSQEVGPLYKDLVEFYESLRQQFPQAVDMTLGLVRVLDNLGLWHKERGEVTEAEPYCLKGLQLLEPLHRAFPTNVILVEMLCNSLLNAGEIQWSNSKPGKAAEAWFQAVTLAAPAGQANHRLRGLAPKLSSALQGVGAFLKDSGTLVQAEDFFRRAIEIQTELRNAAPRDTEAALGPARPAGALAVLLSETCRSTEAVAIYREQLPVLETLLHASHALHQTNARELLATYLVNQGWLLIELGHSDQALELLERARLHYTERCAGNPQVTAYTTTLAKVLNNLSIAHTDRGRTMEAEQTYDEALTLCDQVLAVNLHDQEALEALGWTLNEGGRLFWWQGQADRARSCWERARGLLEPSAVTTNLRQILGQTLSYLALPVIIPESLSSGERGIDDEAGAARALIDRGQILYAALFKFNAEDARTQRGRAVWLTQVSRILLSYNQAGLAAPAALQATQILEPLAQADAVHAGYRQALAEAQLVQGEVLGGKDPQALAALTKASENFEELAHLDGQHLGWKLGLARCLVQMQQWERARPLLDAVLAILPGNLEARSLKDTWGKDPPIAFRSDYPPSDHLKTLNLDEPAAATWAGRADLTVLDQPALASWETLCKLAQAYRGQGKVADALALYRRALAISEDTLGPDHPQVGKVLMEQADLHCELKDYTVAEALYRRALAISEHTLGPEYGAQKDLALTCYNLGECLRLQSKPAEALAWSQRALQIREKVLGPDHALVGQALNALGLISSVLPERESQAVAYFEKAIAVYERASGVHSIHVAFCLENLVDVERRRGHSEQAVALCERALLSREKSGDQLAVAQVLWKLGECRAGVGDFTTALDNYRRALDIQGKVLGAEHPNMANSLYELAKFCQSRNYRNEARQYYERALAIYRILPKTDPFNVPACLFHLALLAHEQGEYATAAPLYQEALALFEKFLPPEHANLIVARGSYASLIMITQTADQAESTERNKSQKD
jgi:tetratricopeptide (TPR) repeat protein